MTEFILLGGMILIMGIWRKVPAMAEAEKTLTGLQIPIGIVVFLKGLSLIVHPGFVPARRGVLVFAGIMGLIAGIMLIINLFKLITHAEDTVERVSTQLAAFQIPIGFITIIAGIIGMF
jgi:uncharacterized membrane protein